MLAEKFALSDYLSFLGWKGEGAPQVTYDTLEQIHLLHSTKIPFDNFDMHVASPTLSVHPSAVWEKVRHGTRGTYCFEGNYLLTEALQQIGFRAQLIPVCYYRHVLGSFAPIPSHCNVVVELDGRWYLLDSATVDTIDGILELKIDSVQEALNGARYRLSVVPDKAFTFTEESENRIRAVNPNSSLFDSDGSNVSLVLEKEEVRRDSDYHPIEPLAFDWLRRFLFRLPRSDIPLPDNISNDNLLSLFLWPPALDYAIAELLVEYTAILDERANHFKQWVAIRINKERKTWVTGFRFIQTARPFGPRHITRYEAVSEDPLTLTDEVMMVRFEQVRKHLADEVGIILPDDFVARLNIRHNYTPKSGKSNDFVWAF